MLPLGEVFVEIVGLDVFGFVAHGEEEVVVGYGDGCGHRLFIYRAIAEGR